MTIKDFLDSIEELCFSLMANLVLLIKTILKLYTDKRFSFTYITTELDKEKDRFMDFISPVKLSVYALAIFLLASAKPEDFGFLPLFKPFTDLPFFDKIILVFGVTNLIPLVVAVIILLANKENITFISIKKPLYILIYSFASYYMVWIIFALLLLILTPPLNYIDTHNAGFLKSEVGKVIEFFFLIAFVLLFAFSFFYSIFVFMVTMYYSMHRLLIRKKKLALYICATLLIAIVAVPILLSTNW